MINGKRLLENFLNYVKIDSESGKEGTMTDLLVRQLGKLGCKVKTDDAGKKTGSDGSNVYASFKGSLPGEPLILSAHMDTVVPGRGIEPEVRDGIVSSKGDTILGGDDKSGIAAIVEALTVIREKRLPCRNAEVVISIGEEQGMLGAKVFDFGSLKGREAVVLDGAGPVGTIIPNGPGQMTLTAAVLGKAAHAGLAPEKGISSIQVAARAVAAMKLLRIDDETTCNIGTFKSEGPTNIVPSRTDIEAEIRSRSAEKLQAQADHMVNCLKKACDDAGAELQYSLKTKYVAFSCPTDHPLMKKLTDALSAIGRQPHVIDGGGGSDANIMAPAGIVPVVVSTGMCDVHTTRETLAVKDLEDSARLVLQLLIR
ncbi:MAG: M20/M25/M40 family metallo-hydrolase [Pyramidobacter sp.]